MGFSGLGSEYIFIAGDQQGSKDITDEDLFNQPVTRSADSLFTSERRKASSAKKINFIGEG
jgi:hypothetical protein